MKARKLTAEQREAKLAQYQADLIKAQGDLPEVSRIKLAIADLDAQKAEESH